MFRFVIVLLFGPLLYAQSVGGTIVGAVKDQSGAALPGAEIAINNSATGINREMLTNETGTYRAVNLQPGSYEVTVGMPGFSVAQRNVSLNVGAEQVLDFELVVAGVTNSVDVT